MVMEIRISTTNQSRSNYGMNDMVLMTFSEFSVIVALDS